MLPPGHIAAGYIISELIFKIGKPTLSTQVRDQLLFWGMFFSFAPDLDTFIVFKKVGKFISSDDINHRKFYSHMPFFWFLGGMAILTLAIMANNLFLKYFGLMLWLGSWSHFALDTIQTGIPWLGPFSDKIFVLNHSETETNIKTTRFFPYWIKFMKFYITKGALTFYLETAVITAAAVLFFHG